MRFIVTIALAAAAAAIVVPTAFAQSGSPDDRPGVHGIGPSAMVSRGSDDRTFVRGTGAGPAVALASDDRVAPRGSGPSPVALGPDDRPGARAVFETSPPVVPVTQAAPSDDGFDWGAAGIGLSVGIALMLLAAGAIVTLRRSRHTLAHQ